MKLPKLPPKKMPPATIPELYERLNNQMYGYTLFILAGMGGLTIIILGAIG